MWAIGDLDPVRVVVQPAGTARMTPPPPRASVAHDRGAEPPAGRRGQDLTAVCMLLIVTAVLLFVAAYVVGYAAGSALRSRLAPSSLAGVHN